jgi:hypothetical protein
MKPHSPFRTARRRSWTSERRRLAAAAAAASKRPLTRRRDSSGVSGCFASSGQPCRSFAAWAPRRCEANKPTKPTNIIVTTQPQPVLKSAPLIHGMGASSEVRNHNQAANLNHFS